MRRALLPWLIALGIAVLLGAGAVAVLNATVFGPGAFVQVYLGALARGDVSDALSLPGVHTGVDEGEHDSALLTDGATGGLSDIHQIADDARGGRHFVAFAWTTPSRSGTTTFQVHRVGTRFGLFPEWGFAASPVATVELTVENDAGFTVNGVQKVSSSTDGRPVSYAVLVPGEYVFSHTSTYLTARPDAVVTDTVNQTQRATVSTRANREFVAATSKLVDAQLTACTAQTVLFPTGCSFGESITNRVSSTPAWSIVHPPVITLVPGAQFGTWAIPSSPGTAHLTVKVTSLFDGTESTFDQDVPFLLQADVLLNTDGSITVAQR